jgi:hypothetical protein
MAVARGGDRVGSLSWQGDEAMQAEHLPIETFDALLRDLLTWSLVEPEATPSGTAWRLTEDAARRLDELSRTRPLSADRVVYFDHRCARCGARRPTWLREGRYLCEVCLAAPREDAAVPIGSPATRSSRPGAPPGRPGTGRRLLLLGRHGPTRAEAGEGLSAPSGAPGAAAS